jgi:hypothetical protein
MEEKEEYKYTYHTNNFTDTLIKTASIPKIKK